MRILVINQYFHPDRSATGQLLTELCEDLSLHHDVHVVTGRPSYHPEGTSAARGLISHEWHGRVHVARVWSSRFDRSVMPGRLLNYATYLTTAVLGSFRSPAPDVVMALTDPPPVGLVGAAVARVRRVPFVLVTKDVFPDVAIRLGKLRNPAVIRALRRSFATLYGRADVVVSIGRDMNRRLSGLGVPESKIRLINDWSDGHLIRPLPGPSDLRRAEGWSDRFVVMHSGNVGLSQSLETLIEAADLLRSRRDVVFAIVGDGASRAALEREASRRNLVNVRFLPYQPRLSLSDSLGGCDLHLVSLRRGLGGYIVPSKVYGIMAAGKPFIAAVEAGSEPALIVEEHGCGIRIEPDDPEALAEAVVRMQDAPLADMGRRARAAFEARYERHLATGSYRTLMEALVAGGAGAPDVEAG